MSRRLRAQLDNTETRTPVVPGFLFVSFLLKECPLSFQIHCKTTFLESVKKLFYR